MDKTYNHQQNEPEILKLWESGDFFAGKIIPGKKPFSILLPLPNANDPIHMGHCLFTVQDIMVRYHRMLGEPTLWLPGADHAGIETQYVFEKQLAKEGKSRFDFNRETLYKMISDFVEQNRHLNREQMIRMGFSLDWNRYHYSLEPEIIEKVIKAFKKLHNDGLVYRGERIVNYCTKCGTAFSDLEVEYKEKDDFLYYLNYGPISIATTRPETIFADVAIAVNPKDKRFAKLIGQSAIIPLIDKEIPIITDSEIDVEFGTGALKVTPAHDTADYAIGQKNNLEVVSVIDSSGRLINVPEKYLGLKISPAREAVIKDLRESGKLIKMEPLEHNVAVCYRCKNTIEPMIVPQWYIKTKGMAEKAIEAVKSGKTKIVPKKRFEKMYFDWLENIHDWNISRQIVWGPRIPVWYCLDCNNNIIINFIDKAGEKISGKYADLKKSHSFEEIKDGLQAIIAGQNPVYQIENEPCHKCQGKNTLQETDTFDTWFLSGQWPLNTLGFNINNPKESSEDFKYYYPTSVLDTLWDILFFWVGRMMMLGLYFAGDVPFKTIHIHARVIDQHGQKMSKSKGNVINPMDMVAKYGADSMRMALIISVAPASDIAISEDKIRAMRNFTNKIWNAARFVLQQTESEINSHPEEVKNSHPEDSPQVRTKDPKQDSGESLGILRSTQNDGDGHQNDDDKQILKKTADIAKKVTDYIEDYKFGLASEELYHFFWHEFCDEYIEKTKTKNPDGSTSIREEAVPILKEVLTTSLKLLHPFMPFVTEAVWQKLSPEEKPLCISPWPK